MALALLPLLLALAPAAALVPASRVPIHSYLLLRPLRMTAIADGDPMTGTCKWFNVEKGYGFISVDDNENDIFVHQSDIYAPGFRSLAEGEQLEFRVQTDAKTGKLKAVEVTGPDGAYVQGAPKQDRDDYY